MGDTTWYTTYMYYICVIFIKYIYNFIACFWHFSNTTYIYNIFYFCILRMYYEESALDILRIVNWFRRYYYFVKISFSYGIFPLKQTDIIINLFSYFTSLRISITLRRCKCRLHVFCTIYVKLMNWYYYVIFIPRTKF